MAEGLTPSALIPPAVAALKEEAAGQGPVRGQMERSISMDIREEREELREAAEQCLNVIMDLGLDNHIRWVSPTWRDVVGTEPDAVVGKPIAHILLSDKDAFSEAVESMRKDDSRSRIIRFATSVGPLSVLQPKSHKTIVEGEDAAQTGQVEEQDRVLNLEAQGIIVYDRTSGEESHVSLPLAFAGTVVDVQLDDVDDSPLCHPRGYY